MDAQGQICAACTACGLCGDDSRHSHAVAGAVLRLDEPGLPVGSGDKLCGGNWARGGKDDCGGCRRGVGEARCQCIEMIPAMVQAAVAAATEHADATISLRVPEVYQSNQLFDVWVEGRHLIAKQFLKEDEWE